MDKPGVKKSVAKGRPKISDKPLEKRFQIRADRRMMEDLGKMKMFFHKPPKSSELIRVALHMMFEKVHNKAKAKIKQGEKKGFKWRDLESMN